MICVVVYILLIALYTRISKDPIIFVASLAIDAAVAFIGSMMVFWLLKGIDEFTVFSIGCVYFLGIVVFAVFGPTFIDRSISYHIAFAAVEDREVDIEEMQEVFSKDIFEKRVHDAEATGFVIIKDEKLLPTGKAEVMYWLLMPVGKLTNSLGTYYDMKEALDYERYD